MIVISSVEELESIVRCIEMGATDYLPKPFQPAILRARVDASLAGKRLRDLELEYLEQVFAGHGRGRRPGGRPGRPGEPGRGRRADRCARDPGAPVR